MAFSVLRTYLGGQLARGEGVTEDCAYRVRGGCISGDLERTHIRREDYRRRRLVKVCHMERLALHAEVNGLQRIEAHLLRRRLRGLLAANCHLRERLEWWLWLSWIAGSRRLIPSLRRAILWLSAVRGLGRRRLHVRIAILRLVRHAVCRLLLLVCLLRARVSVSAHRLRRGARVLAASRLLPSQCRIWAGSKFIRLARIRPLLLAGLRGRRGGRMLVVGSAVLHRLPALRVGFAVCGPRSWACHLASSLVPCSRGNPRADGFTCGMQAASLGYLDAQLLYVVGMQSTCRLPVTKMASQVAVVGRRGSWRSEEFT